MSEDDFDSVVLFLIQHEWIYDFKLTRYCVDKAYENIPHEWRDVLKTLTYEDLANLSFGRVKDNWPSSMKNFVRSCLTYSIPRDQVTLLPWKQDAHILTEDCNHLSSSLNDGLDVDRSSIVTSSCSACCKFTSVSNSHNLGLYTSGHLTHENLQYSKNDYYADCSGTHKLENSGDIDKRNIISCKALNQTSEERPNVSFGHSFQTNLAENSRLLKSDFNMSGAMNSMSVREEDFNNFKKPQSTNSLQNHRSHVAVLDKEIQRGMSEKKWHEVHHMTGVIDQVTKKAGNNVIVDVGSGLGYLGHVLHTMYGHNVLGLEGKQGHAQGAVDRLKISDSCGRLQNITCELYDDKRSESEFIQIVHDWFSKFSSKDKSCFHYVNQPSNKPSLTKRSQKRNMEKEQSTTKDMNNEPESGY